MRSLPILATHSIRILAPRGLCGLLAAWLLLASGTATATTIDFRAAGGSGGYGNSLVFSSGGISVTASAWAETGAALPASPGYFAFQTAEIHSWGTGLGICNRSEGLASAGCSSDEHEVDSAGRDDLLVLVFSQRVNFLGLTVDPWDGPGSDPNDRDIVYRIGDLLGGVPDLSSHGFATLGDIAGMGGEQLSAALSAYSPLTHALTGTGNVLFLGGNHHDRSCSSRNISADSECEAYKIRGIAFTLAPAVVPLPASSWLLATGLGVLALVRRQSRW
ncbi:MAG: VPLPA-CTERM sorting domain-containing protein [Proteobacteria bacterium]|nr:MAG: VPLPA-CTERM sorting domain-containing protein [Pseudomonadota bacterium]